MHAIHPDPHRLMVAAAAALLLIVAVLALAPAAGDLDLRLGGSPAASGQPAPVTVRSTPSQPRWVAHPLTPPSPAAP
jgi:hypothetical protein